MAAPTYLTPDQVVARLQNVIQKKTLANWRSAGEGPPFSKFGGRVLYPEAAFEVWEATKLYGSTKDYGAIKPTTAVPMALAR